MDFAPLPTTLGAATKVKLIPHMGEFDQAVLFRAQLDYEPEVFRWLERDAASRYDAVIEIGANIGVYTVFLDAQIESKAGSRLQKIISFEPSLEAYSRLLRNLQANKSKHVFPFRSAVAGVSGFVELFEPEGHLTNGSLVRDFANLFSRRLDSDLVFGHGPADIAYFLERYPKVLIKIDVEGYEPQLLEALGDLILRYQPDLIVEVLSESLDTVRAVEWLRHYDLFHIRDEGLVQEAELSASDRHRDWFFQPKPELLGNKRERHLSGFPLPAEAHGDIAPYA